MCLAVQKNPGDKMREDTEYEPPGLTEYGGFEKITKGNGSGQSDGSSKNPNAGKGKGRGKGH